MKRILLWVVGAALFTACASQKNNQKDQVEKKMEKKELVGTYWVLTELMGQPVEKGTGKKEAYLLLQSVDNRLNTSAGCNGIGGNYKLEGEYRIHFSGLISTMMACPEPLMTLENNLKAVLEKADNYAINGDEMMISKARMAPLARFKAGVMPKGF